MKKCVWLNLNTGEFSNSWTEEDVKCIGGNEALVKDAKEPFAEGWKLIEYTCLNDDRFEFYSKMKIITNTK